MEIMSAHISRFTRICTLSCCCLVGQAAGLFAGELVLQKVPPLTVEQAPAYPENVARYHLGAQVVAAPQSNPIASLQLSSKSEDHNIAEAALLCDDPTVGYALSNGSTTLIISLSRIENIDNITFLNNGVKGDVTVATSSTKLSADSSQWNKAVQQNLSSDVVKAKIGPSEAKYVKLTFNVTEPGRIAGLGVYSTPAVSDFTMPRSRKVVPDKSESFALISYNLTDVHAKARALYVSSGEDLKQANNMIDDQPATSYSFAANDAAPTAIIDLGKVTTLRRISAIYSPRQGTVDFYVLQSLPAGQATSAIQLNIPGQSAEESRKGALSAESAPKTLRINDTALADLKPVGSVVGDGTGRAAVDFPSTTGRYIMLKWTPATPQDTAFSVAEIAAFGGREGQATSSLMVANTSLPGAGAGEAVSDGKDAKDFGEGKEAKEVAPPAEGPPPTLPDPPPFVFVPLIVPLSP